MTLIVEDGSIVPGAESLCSVEYADAYHAARGNADWAALSTGQKEQSLRKATDYITGQYSDKWAGFKKDADQALDWPRSYVEIKGLIFIQYVPDDIVPTEVKNACASLALRASAGSLLADEEKEIIREKVDVIETEYSPSGSQRKRYPEIDAALKKYLAFSGDAVRVVRV